MISKEKLFSWNTGILLLILLAGFFFRFWNTPDRYGFDPDPARDGLIAEYAVRNLELPLSGPPSGIAPFSFGPWYYYQLIAAEALLPFDYAPWIYLGIVSMLFIVVMYYVGKELKNTTLGLFLAFFAAFSPSLTGPSAGLSNPNFIPLFTGLFILFAIKFMKKKVNTWHLLAWGAVFGIGINHHYQVAILLLIPILSLILNREKILKSIALFILGAAIVCIPSLIFELQNNWHNTRGVIFYLTEGRKGIYIPNSWKLYTIDFWIPFFSYILGAPQILSVMIAGLLVVANIVALVKKNISPIYVILMITLLIDILFLRYFSSQREYYYYLFTIPFIIVFLGYSLSLLGKFGYLKYLPFIIIGTLIPFMVRENMSRLEARQDLVEHKALATYLKYYYPDQKFVFYECEERKIDKVFAINYFFMKENLLDESGTKIGFASDGCTKLEKSRLMSEVIFLPIKKAYDITDLSEEELSQTGWRKVTPKTIYEGTVTVKK